MSYARFADGDVYVYEDYSNNMVCMTYDKTTEKYTIINKKTKKEMLEHLLELKRKGMKIPDNTIDAIKAEIN